nr:hypothetical protein [Tanacetum cinerariifolium]
MNYVPVDAGTNSTNLLGTKDAANQVVRKNESSLRYILLLNWAHDALLESTSSKPYEESRSQVPEGSRNPNSIASTFNPPAEQMETLTVESPIPTVSSPVPTACLHDSSEPSSKARLVSRKELETLKEEKDVVDRKLARLRKSLKDLEDIIESQRPSPTIESTPAEGQNKQSTTAENGESTDSILSKPAVKFVKA